MTALARVVEFCLEHWLLIVAAALVSALGVQTYRLQGAGATIAQYEADEEHREEMVALMQQEYNTAKRRADEDHAKRTANLDRELAGLRGKLRQRARTSGDVVPAAASGGDGVPGGGVICFARDRLAAGVGASLDRFEDRLAALAEGGARAIAGFETCASWALENYRGK